MTERRRYVGGVLLAGAIVAADQVSKHLVASSLVPGLRREIIPGLMNFVLSHNTGGAFGMLTGRPTFFLGLAVLALGLLAYLFVRLKHKLGPSVAVACVAAGAVGNLIDRFRYGFVIDFVDLHFRGLHWYVFNVADVAISAGAVTLLISTVYDEIRAGRKKRSGVDLSPDGQYTKNA